jgi:hypothetical protein
VRKFIGLYYFIFMFSCLLLQAEITSNFDKQLVSDHVLLEVQTPIGMFIAYRPDLDEMQRTSGLAKAIFQEAFSTTYRDYYRKSGSNESIEKWLRLKEGLTLESWLSNTFDGEYEEYLLGLKGFIYLCDSDGNLVGWLSHSFVSETGEMYLSQCSLEAGSRNQKVTSIIFAETFKNGYIKKIFPGVKVVKLIARKINTIAHRLYTKVGFIMDETIDPSVYGDSYDDRYVGYQLILEE